jgi:16S rRNA (cytosine967-C5)-methyltransferase
LDTALNEASLEPREAALAARLCFTVVQHHSLIDAELAKHVKKTQPQVKDILRLGAAQLWYFDRVPRYALTNEAVSLCKKTAPHAAGMVNAVLMRLPDTPPETDDLSVKYSLPVWFLEKMRSLLPEDELEPFCESCNSIPPVYIQRNTLKPYADQSGVALRENGGYVLTDPSALEGILRKGWGLVADPGAKECVDRLAPDPGEQVWDVCAAPGGKTLMAAFAMGNKGRIFATDKERRKLPLLRETLSRCGVYNTDIRQADGATYTPDKLFDAVLCDVPCSGFGVLRKKPDIRFRTETAHFPALQLGILSNAAKSVGDGGRLLYSTCTLLPEENEGVTNAFLRENGGFTMTGQTTLWPHRGDTDGFYICLMTKK